MIFITFIQRLFFILFLLVAFMHCRGKKHNIDIQAYDFAYQHNNNNFEGYFAFPKNLENQSKEKVPGILLIHEWVGLGDYIKMRARKFAKLNYAVFAMDMYGKDVRAKDHEEAGKLMQIYMDNRSLMLERTQYALRVLKSQTYINTDKIAAIGYCFGGAVVLELALNGAELSGGVTFHGVLATPNLEKNANQIRMELLFHHGAKDPMLSQNNIQILKDSLDKADVDYSFISYPDAVHGFTRISANSENTPALQYNEKADIQSWNSTEKFLRKIFR